jgi:beta-galactosidase
VKKSIALFVFTILISLSVVKSQEVNPFFPEKELITTGIYYYPEHWKESQWERDIKKISDMGYEFVHLAEFAWFKMEPEEGNLIFPGWTRWSPFVSNTNLKSSCARHQQLHQPGCG